MREYYLKHGINEAFPRSISSYGNNKMTCERKDQFIIIIIQLYYDHCNNILQDYTLVFLFPCHLYYYHLPVFNVKCRKQIACLSSDRDRILNLLKYIITYVIVDSRKLNQNKMVNSNCMGNIPSSNDELYLYLEKN